MSNKLKKDICNLRPPGALATEVDENRIEQFIPDELQYACRYWVQHLQESINPLINNGDVHSFLRRHLLCWLEALSLLRKTSEGISALRSLESLVKVNNVRKHRKVFELTSIQRSTKIHHYTRLFMMRSAFLSVFDISLKKHLCRYTVQHYYLRQK